MQPTLLCMPGLGRIKELEHVLPKPPSHYTIEQARGLWWVRCQATHQLIYAGPGPVRIELSPAPF